MPKMLARIGIAGSVRTDMLQVLGILGEKLSKMLEMPRILGLIWLVAILTTACLGSITKSSVAAETSKTKTCKKHGNYRNTSITEKLVL